jgi:hypothetical protein
MRERLAGIDFVTAGRLLGAVIIIAGIVLAMFNASATENYANVGSHPKLRAFVEESLVYVWSGGIILIVTELLARLNGDGRDIPINWNIAELVRILGFAVIVLGTLAALGDIKAARDLANGQSFPLSSRVGGGSDWELFRSFLAVELRTCLWQGSLLILLSSLADRVGWRADDETLGGEPPTAPADAPP